MTTQDYMKNQKATVFWFPLLGILLNERQSDTIKNIISGSRIVFGLELSDSY